MPSSLFPIGAELLQVLSWSATGNQRTASPEALQPLFQELLREIELRCIPLAKVAQGVSNQFRFVKVWAMGLPPMDLI